MIRRLIFALWAISLMLPAAAQVQRQFPQTALRGEIVFGQPPELQLNGETARLAPGARIRSENNMIVLSGSLIGSRHVVHYTSDPQGQIKDVWILQPQERAMLPWPRTVKEGSTWQFDVTAQKWTIP
jgi:hypothetical protein